jgi:hypothetical protein
MNSIEPLLINCFIALMLFILWSWDLPEHSRLNRWAVKLQWPIERLGLFHSWRMFSPDPTLDNFRLQFQLRLADGSVVAIEPEYFRFPAAQQGPVCYRWTKIKLALLWLDSSPLRASVCKYVAAEFLAKARQPDKRPVEVQLVRWRQPIAPFAAKEASSPAPYKRRIIYTQPISPATTTRAVEPAPLSIAKNNYAACADV